MPDINSTFLEYYAVNVMHEIILEDIVKVVVGWEPFSCLVVWGIQVFLICSLNIFLKTVN